MRRLVATIVTAAMLSGLAAAPALAKKKKAVFVAAVIVNRVDTSNDNFIQADEWSAAGAPAAAFTMVDANADGQLGYFEILRAVIVRALKGRAG